MLIEKCSRIPLMLRLVHGLIVLGLKKTLPQYKSFTNFPLSFILQPHYFTRRVHHSWSTGSVWTRKRVGENKNTRSNKWVRSHLREYCNFITFPNISKLCAFKAMMWSTCCKLHSHENLRFQKEPLFTYNENFGSQNVCWHKHRMFTPHHDGSIQRESHDTSSASDIFNRTNTVMEW